MLGYALYPLYFFIVFIFIILFIYLFFFPEYLPSPGIIPSRRCQPPFFPFQCPQKIIVPLLSPIFPTPHDELWYNTSSLHRPVMINNLQLFKEISLWCYE